MAVNIRKMFKRHCGPGARYLGSELRFRGEHNTVVVTFEIVPEGRRFNLDGVLHEGDTPDEQIERAVVKIAGIAKNIRDTLAAPDGGPGRPSAPEIKIRDASGRHVDPGEITGEHSFQVGGAAHGRKGA